MAALLVLAVAYWGWRGTPGTSSVDRPTNVLLITLDTVRADRIGAYGYAGAKTPNLDALARDGVRFDDAVAAAPITGPAHAALLTGKYPGRLGVLDNITTPLPAEAITLAQLLADRGFATGGFVGAFVLDRPYGFAKGFEEFDSGFKNVEPGREGSAERRADDVVDDAVHWLSSLGARRFFAWVHLYDAHAPYAPPEPFLTGFAGRPYDGEIAFVDQEIGRLLGHLRSLGLSERTLVIVVADHGEALGDHDEDTHGFFLYQSVMRIPWLVSGPGVKRGEVVRGAVRSVDLSSTVMHALGLEVPPGLDGEDLSVLLTGGQRTSAPPAYAETHYPRLHFGWSELRSIRAGEWKAIDAPEPELYNLREDPGERTNVFTKNPELGTRMVAEAVRLGHRMLRETKSDLKQPDPSELARLRSLGYVGNIATAPSGTRGPDPKHMIAEHRRNRVLMSEAMDDLAARRTAAAVTKLERILATEDQSYDLNLLLAQAYEQQRGFTKARDQYLVAARLNPQAATPLLAAAEMDVARGDVKSARSHWQGAVQREPESKDAPLVLGRILEAENSVAEAIAAFDRAVELNPANPKPRTLLISLATRTQQFDLAETNLKKLLEMGYQPSRTHFGLGRIAEMQGRKDDAVRHYRTALDLEPGLPMAQQALQRLGQ